MIDTDNNGKVEEIRKRRGEKNQEIVRHPRGVEPRTNQMFIDCVLPLHQGRYVKQATGWGGGKPKPEPGQRNEKKSSDWQPGAIGESNPGQCYGSRKKNDDNPTDAPSGVEPRTQFRIYSTPKGDYLQSTEIMLSWYFRTMDINTGTDHHKDWCRLKGSLRLEQKPANGRPAKKINQGCSKERREKEIKKPATSIGVLGESNPGPFELVETEL
ncbi:hypothetical protein B0H13DRAFT_1887252 [Mycena leptocephala]|nr:hypothetical protein B0H13DRAFT_1887252 [Mycena leptocephala]